MRRILFVDDEPHILEALQRMLFPMRREWQMVFARSGPEALALLEQSPFDVIVTDVTMPGMDGIALLAEVMKRYPQTIRFVLTGQADQDTASRTVGLAHQFLAKPCSTDQLKSCVERAFSLRTLINETVLHRLAARMDNLPVLPEAYGRLIEELQSPESSVAKVGQIVESDVALTAKVLQLVNSAFFGLRQRVASAAQAVAYLGLDTIHALALLGGVFAQADAKRLAGLVPLDALWEHSMIVGVFGQAIAKDAGLGSEVVKDAFTAGLLHDAGVLILAQECPEPYREVLDRARAEHLPLTAAEQAGFGCTHAQVGAYLFGVWGLPDAIVEAVAFHHGPSQCAPVRPSTLTAVYAGNALARELAGGWDGLSEEAPDDAYLEAVGFANRMGRWRDLCVALRDKGERARG